MITLLKIRIKYTSFIIKILKSKGKYYYISNEYFLLTFLTFNCFFCKTLITNLQLIDFQYNNNLPKSYISFTSITRTSPLILLHQKLIL